MLTINILYTSSSTNTTWDWLLRKKKFLIVFGVVGGGGGVVGVVGGGGKGMVMTFSLFFPHLYMNVIFLLIVTSAPQTFARNKLASPANLVTTDK